MPQISKELLTMMASSSTTRMKRDGELQQPCLMPHSGKMGSDVKPALYVHDLMFLNSILTTAMMKSPNPKIFNA